MCKPIYSVLVNWQSFIEKKDEGSLIILKDQRGDTKRFERRGAQATTVKGSRDFPTNLEKSLTFGCKDIGGVTRGKSLEK